MSPRESTEARVLTEQVALMCRLTIAPLLGSVVIGALFAWLALADHELWHVAGWYAALLAVLFARCYVAWAYPRRPRHYEETKRWRTIMMALAVVGGTVWGIAGTTLIPADPQRETIVSVLFIGTSAAAMGSQVPVRHAYAALLIPFVTPYGIHQFLMGGERVVLALAFLLYIPVVLTIANRQTRAIERQLRLAIENEALAQELRSERDRTEQINRDLEAQVEQQRRSAQRIRDLNTELERQAQELRTANNDLEGFSYSVSHDLRAPLRAIDGFSRLLGDEKSGQIGIEAKHYLRRIRANISQMSALIDDLLEFSRCGTQSLEIARLDMESLARVAAEEARGARIGETSPVIVIDRLPSARGDERLMRRVWINLLDNAVKYSSKVPEPRITVSGREEPDRIIYDIVDNGVGFDSQYSSTLFGVFRRLHGARDYPGTGVGLAIVQRVINRHGGEVWAHSEVNQGATFSFSLPRPVLRAVV